MTKFCTVSANINGCIINDLQSNLGVTKFFIQKPNLEPNVLAQWIVSPFIIKLYYDLNSRPKWQSPVLMYWQSTAY